MGGRVHPVWLRRLKIAWLRMNVWRNFSTSSLGQLPTEQRTLVRRYISSVSCLEKLITVPASVVLSNTRSSKRCVCTCSRGTTKCRHVFGCAALLFSVIRLFSACLRPSTTRMVTYVLTIQLPSWFSKTKRKTGESDSLRLDALVVLVGAFLDAGQHVLMLEDFGN